MSVHVGARHVTDVVDDRLAERHLAVPQAGLHVRPLRPERLEQACAAAGQPLTLRRHAGYDHGYFFIQSFIEEHIAHHAQGSR